MKKKFWILHPFIFFAVLAAGAAVVMLLWNAILPVVIGSVGTLTFWQAAGLMILSRLLFGGFAGHGRHMHNHWHSRHTRKGGGHPGYNHLHETFAHMDPQSRKEMIRKRFCGGDDPEGGGFTGSRGNCPDKNSSTQGE